MASATARRLGEETSKSSALMASRKRADELSARVAMLESQVGFHSGVQAMGSFGVWLHADVSVGDGSCS
jgi:hypothetical protein